MKISQCLLQRAAERSDFGQMVISPSYTNPQLMSAIRQSRTLEQWTSAFSSQSVRPVEILQTPLTAVARQRTLELG